MRTKIIAVALALLTVLGLAGCKTESGERKAGCDGKKSLVVSKYKDPTTGHLMLAVQCGTTIASRWYVSWDDPENDFAEYDQYHVGSVYP